MPDTAYYRQRLFREQNRKCTFCGRFCRWGSGQQNTPTRFTVEHLFPKRFGGTNNPENLTGACYRCNSARGEQIAKEVNEARRKVFNAAKAAAEAVARGAETEVLNRFRKQRLEEREAIVKQRKKRPADPQELLFQ